MTTGDRLIGRGIALVGLAFGVTYLGWRIVATMGDAPVWLAATTLVVEFVGFVAVCALVWALWRAPQVQAARRSPADLPLDIDVLIRCSGQDTESLRATLLASRQLGSLYVLDLGARPEIAALALEADAVYIATDSEDLDGLGQSLHVLAAPTVLILEAGDVPHPDIVDTLAPWLDEPDVAVVQGRAVSAQNDSAEHDAGGRHDKDFDRRALVPSLGARGMGAFTGSGALIRRSALIGMPIGHATRPMVQAEITIGLLREGWRIVAPGGQAVVAVASQTQPDVVESMHACEASGALHLLAGPNGALRINSLGLRQRVALLAMATRPLAGVRRSVVIVVLLASLLSGSLPFQPSQFGLLALWAPWFALSSLGLWVLSDGSLRPGDRLRSSMRLLGASWRGVLAPNGRPEDPQYAVAGAFGVHHAVASAAAVAAISVVVGLRGVSDRLTHTLEPLPVEHTAGLLVVALWSLGGGLDALRLLARRAQSRRATRVASSLPSTFGDRTALVVDLTPHGAGVISEVDLAVGTHDELDVVLPTATGVVTATVPILVRNVRADFSGERRYGVEFGPVPTYVADALAEYCVLQPAIELLGGVTVESGVAQIRPVVVLDDRAMLPRRIGLRAAALVAVAGAMASSVPTSAQAAGDSSLYNGRVVVAGTAVDQASMGAPVVVSTAGPIATLADQPAQFSSNEIATAASLDIVVVDSIAAVAEPAVPGGRGPEGALVTVLCAVDDGADDLWGTSDDVFNGPVSAVVDADGSYVVASSGDACWISVAPPVGYMVPGETSELESPTTPQVLDLSSSTIAPIKIVETARTGPSIGSARVDDVVWADDDSDGVLDPDESFVPGVTVTLFAAGGTVFATGVTSPDGRYAFTDLPEGDYRLGVSNLPAGWVASGVLGMTAPFTVTADSPPNLAIGLRPASKVVPQTDGHTGDQTGDVVPGERREQLRLLPRPDTDQLAAVPDDGSTAAALVVVFLAALMGLSVVAGSVRPGRGATVTRRLQTSQ